MKTTPANRTETTAETTAAKPPKPRFEPVSASVDDYVAKASATATKRAYASDVAHFERHGGTIPAKPATVAAYLAECASRLSVATLERRLIALHQAHRDQGHLSPMQDPLVKQTMKGIRRVKGRNQRRVRPIEKDDLLEMIAMAEQQAPMKAKRDIALLLVGFAGAFRRSELVSLTVADMTEHDSGIELLLRRSKTDQEGEGRTIFIPHAKGKRCPVAALKEWLVLAGIESGPLFRSVNRHDQVRKQGLQAQAVATIIKQIIQKSGRDPKDFAGHSLRAGFVTTAAVQGLQPWQIKEQTGHKSDTVLARYIRPINRRKLPSLL